MSGKFDLVHTEYIPESARPTSRCHRWELTNPEATGIRRINIGKPIDNSFVVSVFMPRTLSETVARGLLPNQTILMEAPPEGWLEDLNTPVTEWVGSAFDNEDCYLLLKQVSGSLTEKAAKVVNEIMMDMKNRYRCE